MTGQLFINNKDAWLTWGVFLVGDSLDNLLLPPPPKAYTENNFRSQDGKQVFIVNTKKDARDVQVEFCIKAESRAEYLVAYKSFIEELSDGVVDISIPSIGMDFKFTVSSYLSLGYYDNFGKLSVRFNEPYNTFIIKDYIEISGRVENIITNEGISDAGISLSVGDHQIATLTTGQSGYFSYRWRISESEYDDLIADYGSVLQLIAQKEGYAVKGISSNIPTTYLIANQQGISILAQLLIEGAITLPDIPVGFNFRGKMIVLTNTNRPMTDRGMFDREDWIGGPISGSRWALSSTFDGGGGGEDEIYIGAGSGQFSVSLWFVGIGWQQTSFTFPDNENCIVDTNTLHPAVGDSWGWDYAVVIVPPPLTIDKIPGGYNLRGRTIEFTNTDKRVPPVVPPEDDPDFTGYGLLTGSVEEPTWGIGYLNFGGTLITATGEGGDFDPIFLDNIAEGGEYDQVWLKTVVTVPDDKDYIVVKNDLPAHEGDDWGFDYAITAD